MEAIHVELANERRELWDMSVHERVEWRLGQTLLCLKWEPKMLRLNSPTLETTKEVPRSVQAIKCDDLGSFIILTNRVRRR